MFRDLLGRLRQSTIRMRKEEAGGLRSAEQFHEIVEAERRRADRNKSTFSLVVFTPCGRKHRPADFARLGRCLDGRLRATDEKGYWDKQSVGVLLPETPADGAWKVADDVLDLWVGRSLLDREVYVYPSGQLPAVESDSSQQAGAACQAKSAQPLESLLVQAIPAWKRAMDILGAATGLVLLSPMMAVAALTVKLTSPGNIFFVQQRDGIGGRPFKIYKFRTMYEGASSRQAELRKYSDQDGPAFKLKNDPRLTTVGRYLRRTCIDELPQLLNVLRGEMSLVGPRPMDSAESKFCTGWQRQRLSVTPGLTCIWQVHGGVNVSFSEWMRMDIHYIGTRSLWQDMKLIAETLLVILFHRGSC